MYVKAVTIHIKEIKEGNFTMIQYKNNQMQYSNNKKSKRVLLEQMFGTGLRETVEEREGIVVGYWARNIYLFHYVSPIPFIYT